MKTPARGFTTTPIVRPRFVVERFRSSSDRPADWCGGFTLIELLVVIAIIGILSSVVLASLYIARLKGADAAIQSDLHTIQNQMELYNGNNNSYGPAFSGQPSPVTSVPGTGTNAFITDSSVNGALKAALSQGGQACWAVGPSGNSYAVSVSLKADSGAWWCVDSSGTPKRTTNACGGGLGGGGTAAACN